MFQKLKCLIAVLLLTTSVYHAQNVSINDNGAAANSNAILDIDDSGNDKGLLIPRLTTAQRTAIAGLGAVDEALTVYDTTTNSYWLWDGTQWVEFGMSGNAWELIGNSGTNASTNFIGTTDAIDWVIRTNNIERVRITSAGNLGFGDNAPFQKMEIKGGTSTWSLAGNAANVDNLYLEDLSATDGNNAVGGSISFSGAGNGGGGAARRHAAISGVQTSTENDHVGLAFYTHNSSTSTASMQESVRITHDGNVGIGTTTPGAELEVAGQIKITGGSPAAGSVLTSDATGLATWQAGGGGADADWTVVGSDQYSAVSGNVGIGITSPTSKLEVAGTSITHRPTSTTAGLTQSIYSGSWVGGTGNGGSQIIGTMGSHRSWHYDVIVTAHDVNSCTNRRSIHQEFLAYRSWTNQPVITTLVTHYDYTLGAGISITFTSNASNEIICTLNQTSGGSTNINYRVLVRLIEAR